MKGLGWGAVVLLILVACRDRPSARSESFPARVQDLNLVRIPGGSFRMGSREDGTERRDPVSVAGFWIGRYEVTAEEYAGYLEQASPACHAPVRFHRRFQPAASISWFEAEDYCRWLSRRCGIRARLPTEAEWEYAARGGISDARYPWGWGEPSGRRACWNARGPWRVGSGRPNRYGLHDMAGNIFEWCRPDRAGALMAPVRGGSWAEKDVRMLRVHHKMELPANYRDADVGFRILVENPE